MSSPRIRILAFIALPVVFAGVLVTTVNVWQSRSHLVDRTTAYGDAMAGQLAITVTDPLMQNDLLSLNVLLSDLLSSNQFAFASVYSPDNRLLAQAGRNSKDLLIFTDDVVFQNAVVGYVQIGIAIDDLNAPYRVVIATSLIVHGMILTAIFIIVWFYGDLLYLSWTTNNTQHSEKPEHEDDHVSKPDEFTIEDVDGDLAILVIKVRPIRQLEANLDKIMQALALYRGEVEITEGDDIIVTFSTYDQVHKAACCGTLIAELMKLTRGNKQVKLGLHVASPADGDDVENARKHATYLASIGDRKLLASRKAYAKGANPEHMDLQEFHSSLTPDGEVYVLESLGPGSQQLIAQQARQFTQA